MDGRGAQQLVKALDVDKSEENRENFETGKICCDKYVNDFKFRVCEQKW